MNGFFLKSFTSVFFLQEMYVKSREKGWGINPLYAPLWVVFTIAVLQFFYYLQLNLNC